MKVEILCDSGCFKKGEVVEAKRFKDFIPEELEIETNDITLWDGDEIFAKRHEPYEGACYLYMFASECKVVEENEDK